MRLKSVGKALMKEKANHHGLNSYAIQGEDGEMVICNGHMCFANFKSMKQQLTSPLAKFVLAVRENKKGKTIRDSYIKFLMNESYLKDVFLTKRLCDATKYGISLDVDASFGQVWTAAVAVRRSWEYPTKVAAWYEMTEAGVHPQIALILSYFILLEEDKMFLHKDGLQSNHEMFNFPSIYEGLSSLLSPLKEGISFKENNSSSFEIFNTTRGDSKKLLPKRFENISDVLPWKEVKTGWSKQYFLNLKDVVIFSKLIEKEIYGT